MWPFKKSNKSNDTQKPQQGSDEVFKDDMIYIDSVPRGATVSLLPRENEKGEAVELGKTPLVLNPSQTPSMRFVIEIKMADYMKAIESIDELKDWRGRFATVQQDYFEFQDASASRVIVGGDGCLISIGPVYDLKWPKYNRLVALFIPKRVKPSVFYPLMSPRGTFQINEREYGTYLITTYGFSAEQSAEAVGTLTRCGKYITRVKSGGGTFTDRIYSLSAQKGNYLVNVWELQVIPGFNDD